jgi:predicted metal-dependent TIM-barrel fold hydrolase
MTTSMNEMVAFMDASRIKDAQILIDHFGSSVGEVIDEELAKRLVELVSQPRGTKENKIAIIRLLLEQCREATLERADWQVRLAEPV